MTSVVAAVLRDDPVGALPAVLLRWCAVLGAVFLGVGFAVGLVADVT